MKTKKEHSKHVTTKTAKNVARTTTENAAQNVTTNAANDVEDPTRRKHNLAVIAEVTRRITAAVERLRNTPVPPGIPWLLAGETENSVRRTIARLRNGTIVPADPSIDPLELADLKERQQVYRRVVTEVFAELEDIGMFLRADLDAAEAEMLAAAVATLNAAKQLPEAKNPDSEIAQSIRRMDRARRHDTGNVRARSPVVHRRKGRKA